MKKIQFLFLSIFLATTLVLFLADKSYAERLIVAYTSDTACYPISNDSTIFFSGVQDSSLQNILILHKVTHYRRPHWDVNDSLSHEIVIQADGSIDDLFTDLKNYGKFYNIKIVEVTLSTKDFKMSHNSISVFPNPVAISQTLTISNSGEGELVSIVCYDTRGVIIAKQDHIQENVAAINVNKLRVETGFIFVRCNFDSGQSSYNRIIVTD